MFSSSARCCFVMSRHHALPMRKNKIAQAVSSYGYRSKHDKTSCCKDIAQTEGKRVEPWPKSDPPPPAWRCACPTDPQPPNYDPYRIKVPDVVVPPLPPSNAKRGVVLTNQPGDRNQHPQYQQGYTQPGYPYQQQADPAAGEAKQEEPSEEGFLGILKKWFGGDKSKGGKGSGETMMEIPSDDAGDSFRDPQFHIGGTCPGAVQDLFHNSPIVHPDYWKPKPEKRLQEMVKDALPKLGYHGKNKYKYAFHEPWKPLDRMALLEQAEKEELAYPGEAEIAETTDKQLT